jgi:hypothetical protein
MLHSWPPEWLPAVPAKELKILNGEIGILEYVLCRAVAKACESLPTGTLVDGEVVATDSEGPNLVQYAPASSLQSIRYPLLRFRPFDPFWPKHTPRVASKTPGRTH